MTNTDIAIVKLTPNQAYFLDDLACQGSDSYLEALDAGARVEGLKLFVPPAAAESLATAIGIRADIADEGNYSIGERSTILGLAKKVARIPGAEKANPLTPGQVFITPPGAYDVVEDDEPVSVSTPARSFDANGRHNGPGPWLTLIHETNRQAKATGADAVFGDPQIVQATETTPYTEVYPHAVVLIPAEEDNDASRRQARITVRSTDATGATYIRLAAAKLGLALD